MILRSGGFCQLQLVRGGGSLRALCDCSDTLREPEPEARGQDARATKTISSVSNSVGQGLGRLAVRIRKLSLGCFGARGVGAKFRSEGATIGLLRHPNHERFHFFKLLALKFLP